MRGKGYIYIIYIHTYIHPCRTDIDIVEFIHMKYIGCGEGKE